MATGIVSWSKTAASNNTADSAVNWQEGQAPSSVNDSGRGMMAATAKYRDDVNGSLLTAGSSTAYTVSTNQGFASLTALDGQTISITMDETSGATPTLAVDGLTAKPIRHATGATLPTGALLAGSVYKLTYANSVGEFLIQNQLAVLPTSLVTTTAINDKAVTYAKIQDVSATKRALGRNTSGAGVSEEVTAEQILDWIGTPAQGDILYHNGSATVRLAAGTLGQQLTSGGASANPSWSSAGGQLFHVQDQRSSGSAGQTIGATTWTAKVLQTTLTNEIASASLSSNQITLPAGTYFADASIHGFANGISACKARIRNTTASITLAIGTTLYTNLTGSIYGLSGQFTLSGTSTLELQVYASAGIATAAAGGGEVEVYADLKIWRRA